MSGLPRVGVVGGTGAVGRSVASQLASWRQYRVRIGSRNAASAQALTASLEGATEWVFVDVQDVSSLAAFCAGCAAIVNCVGPANSIGDKVARAAFAAGAHYVDANGTCAANGLPDVPRSAVLASGMYPGLSGLLPRFLAQCGFDAVDGLTAFIGGCDRLSRTAAIDYLVSLTDGSGEADAAWLDRRRVSHALEGGEEIYLPFFPRPVVLHPYFTDEAECLAVTLGLSELRWYSVFDGRHVATILPVAASRQDAEALVSAAHMDLFGREPYQILLFEMTGTSGQAPVRRTLFLKTSDGAALTGIAAASGVRATLAGLIPNGVHAFAACMDPAMVVDHLKRSPAVVALEVLEGALPTVEEGAI